MQPYLYTSYLLLVRYAWHLMLLCNTRPPVWHRHELQCHYQHMLFLRRNRASLLPGNARPSVLKRNRRLQRIKYLLFMRHSRRPVLPARQQLHWREY